MIWTTQTYYDEIVRRLKANLFPSIAQQGVAGSFCLYRSKDRTRACLVGILIPDGLYQESFERDGLDFLWNSGIIPRIEGWSQVDLRALQVIHDELALDETEIWNEEVKQEFLKRLNNFPNFAHVTKVERL